MGTATVTIIGMNDYMGMMTADFDITPQAPAITGAVCTGFNSARITWNAVANANGYIFWKERPVPVILHRLQRLHPGQHLMKILQDL